MPARLVTALFVALVALLPSACGADEPAPAQQPAGATTTEQQPPGYGYG